MKTVEYAKCRIPRMVTGDYSPAPRSRSLFNWAFDHAWARCGPIAGIIAHPYPPLGLTDVSDHSPPCRRTRTGGDQGWPEGVVAVFDPASRRIGVTGT